MKRAIHRGWEHHAPSQRVACSLRCSQWRFTEKVVGKGDFECEGEFMFDAEVRTMNAFPSISFLFVSFFFPESFCFAASAEAYDLSPVRVRERVYVELA